VLEQLLSGDYVTAVCVCMYVLALHIGRIRMDINPRGYLGRG
jgi:hypothetical protein